MKFFERYQEVAFKAINWNALVDYYPIKSYVYRKFDTYSREPKQAALYIASLCLDLKTETEEFLYVGDFKDTHEDIDYSVYHAYISPSLEGIWRDSYFDWEKSAVIRVTPGVPTHHIYRKKASIIVDGKWEVYVNSSFTVDFGSYERDYYFKGEITSWPSEIKIYNKDFSESYSFTDKELVGIKEIKNIVSNDYHTEDYILYGKNNNTIGVFKKSTQGEDSLPKELIKHLWMFMRTLPKEGDR